MENPETGDWIVYNGEIYNYPELRKEMEALGDHFRSRCDTEAILLAYARWGTECFDRFHGMFAVAIYDRRNGKLILARDPLGIKPFYYAAGEAGFVFGSEVRAVRASGLVPTDIDRRALAGLLAYGAVPSPLTIYKSVKSLDPGTWTELDLGAREFLPAEGLRAHRFWDFPAPQAILDRDEAVREIRNRLRNGARRHLMSDVPLGIFLSSGLDSTSLALMCSKEAPEQLNTFTVSFPVHRGIDEGPVAAETAGLLRTQHHNMVLTESEVLNLAGRWFNSIDQPGVDGINTFIIAGAVRERGIKVALSGLGGDELFGGYPRTFGTLPAFVRVASLMSWLPIPIRGQVASAIFASRPKAQRQKARDMARTRPTLRNLYFRVRRVFSDVEMTTLGFDAAGLDLNEDFLPPEASPDHSLLGSDPRADVSVLESRFYMGNTLLRDSDVYSMAHGLELRVPFLDRSLIDYVFALPGKWRMRKDGVNKPLLSDAIRAEVSASVLNMPKRGFVLPMDDWMIGPLRDQFEDLLRVVRNSGIVDSAQVAATWDDFLRKRYGATQQRAWMLGVLGSWISQNT
jgi:asparagine synthase (glutamine-hydrolysing)